MGATTTISVCSFSSRARCSEIWCVDPQADKSGKASVLRQVLALAGQIGHQNDLDPDGFAESQRRPAFCPREENSVRRQSDRSPDRSRSPAD